MATLAPRRFAEVDRLKIMSPSYLRALLLPHAVYLESRGVLLPSIEDGEIDLVMLSGVLMNPDENMPPRLVDALYLINEMATDEGMDALLEAVQRSGRSLEAGASRRLPISPSRSGSSGPTSSIANTPRISSRARGPSSTSSAGRGPHGRCRPTTSRDVRPSRGSSTTGSMATGADAAAAFCGSTGMPRFGSWSGMACRSSAKGA